VKVNRGVWGLALVLSGALGIAVPSAGASNRAQPAGFPSARVVSSVPPKGAVSIGTNADAQQIVNDAPAGSNFVLASGVHQLFTVIPKGGDSFYGRPGTILNGDHIEVSAFRPPRAMTVDGIRIIGSSLKNPLVIENYGKSHTSQVAAVQSNSESTTPPLYSSGWRLQWVEVTGSSSRGISLSDQMVIVGCKIVGNDRLGIGGGGNGITISDNTISGNGLSVARRGWEAGGVKTVADRVLISGNDISGNGAPGVWTDAGASNVEVLDNQFSADRYGVRVEISRNVTVTGNVFNDMTQQSVLVLASDAVTVDRNSLSGNFGGIIVGGVGTKGPGGLQLGDVTISDNSIVDSGTTGLHQTPLPGMVISFDGDHFVHEHLQWDGHGVTFAALQALGQEIHGTWSS
jgi:hypothetical protein